MRDPLANTIHACGDHSGVNLNSWMTTSTSWPFFGANPLNSHRLFWLLFQDAVKAILSLRY